MAQIAIPHHYWCEECQKHAYPADVAFVPGPGESHWDESFHRHIVVIYRCRGGHVWKSVEHVMGTDGQLWPEYEP